MASHDRDALALSEAAGRDDVWFVALDVDGTILYEDETLTPAIVAAVRAARDRGHRASGRRGAAIWDRDSD